MARLAPTQMEDQFLRAIIQPNDALTLVSYQAIQRYLLEKHTGKPHPFFETSLKDRNVYHLEEILTHPALKNKKIDLTQFNHHLVINLTLLYRYAKIIGHDGVLTFQQFRQMTGQTPREFYTYLKGIQGVKTGETPLCYFHPSKVYREHSQQKITSLPLSTVKPLKEEVNLIPLLDKPLDKGVFNLAPISTSVLPEAVFINVLKFTYFILYLFSGVKWDIGDRKILHIENLFLMNNMRLIQLPNVEYEGLTHVHIENCFALKTLPDHWYKNPNLTIEIKCCPMLTLKTERKCKIILT